MDCFKQLEDGINIAKPNPLAARVPPKVGRAADLGFGVVSEETGFAHKMKVARDYKAWAQAKGIPWAAKGNYPLMYETEFLKTLTPDSFVNLQKMIPTVRSAAMAEFAPTVSEAAQKMLQEYKSAKVVEVHKLNTGMNTTEMHKMNNGKHYLLKDSHIAEIEVEEVYTGFADELKTKIVAPTAKVSGPVETMEGGQKVLGTQGRMVQGWQEGKIYDDHAFDWAEVQYDPKEYFEDAGVKRLNNVLSKYIETTKEGSDFAVMDYLMGQTDRHGGNFMFKISEAGKVSDLKLIDNGLAFHKEACEGFTGTLGTEVNGFALHEETAKNLKGFLQRMGWDEAAPNWNLVGENVSRYFEKYKLGNYDMGYRSPQCRAYIPEFKHRLEALVENEFKYNANLNVRYDRIEKRMKKLR